MIIIVSYGTVYRYRFLFIFYITLYHVITGHGSHGRFHHSRVMRLSTAFSSCSNPAKAAS